MSIRQFTILCCVLGIMSWCGGFLIAALQARIPKVRHLAPDEIRLAKAALATEDAALQQAVQLDTVSPEEYKAAVEAQGRYARAAHTDDGKRFGRVLEVYLTYIGSYGQMTERYASLKYKAHIAENTAERGQIEPGALRHIEATGGNAAYSRSFMLQTLQACRDEADSYILPNFHPPTDVCLFRPLRQNVLARAPEVR